MKINIPATLEQTQEFSEEHVDVRGVHPVYVCGQTAFTLEGKRRDISLDDAREYALYLNDSRITVQ